MTRPTREELNDIRSRLCSDDRDLVALCDAYVELEAELQEQKDNRMKLAGVYADCNKHLHKQIAVLTKQNAALTSILHDYLARMSDTYDGTCDSHNRMPFTGSDLHEIEKLL